MRFKKYLIALSFLCLSLAGFASVEFEPNDSLATAQSISLGETITGSLSSGYDNEVDYFALIEFLVSCS